MVERYEFTCHNSDPDAVNVNHGRYVRYSDYAELAAENERLNAGWDHTSKMLGAANARAYEAEKAMTEALASTGAVKVKVKVKALEWQGTDRVWHKAYAEFGGLYRITEYPGMAEPFKMETDGWWEGLPCSLYKTLEDAKAAAQADYERRILSALDNHPRATNTVVAHETANVSDKPEGQQEPVDAWQRRVLYPENGAKPQWEQCSATEATDQFARSPHHEYRPLFTRPSEQAVTDEMVEAALAEKDKEIAALRDALKQTVEIVRQHIPNIPPDGPTSAEHQSAYEAVGFALQDLERYVISRNYGGNPIYQGHPTEQERLYRNTEPRDGFVEEGIIPVDVWGPPMAGGEIFTIRASLAQEDGR